MPEREFRLSAKAVIRDAEGRCLLLRRSMKSKNNKGKWDLPGGKVDAGEAFERALLREVQEEAGLAVSLERVIGAAESVLPTHSVVYVVMEARAAGGDVRLSDEHEEYAWVERRSLPTMDVCGQFRSVLDDYAQAAEA